MNAFRRAIAVLSNICGVIAAAMILASVIITCQMIFVRAVLNESTIWQTEAVIYLMIGATLLGLPYVQLKRGHVNVDLVPMLLPVGARRVLTAFTLLLTMAVAGAIGWYGWELFQFAWDRNWRSDTVWGAPLWVPYLALPFGFGLYLLQLVADLTATLEGKD